MEAILITFYLTSIKKQGPNCKSSQESTKAIIHSVPEFHIIHIIQSFLFIYLFNTAIFAYSERQVY